MEAKQVTLSELGIEIAKEAVDLCNREGLSVTFENVIGLGYTKLLPHIAEGKYNRALFVTMSEKDKCYSYRMEIESRQLSDNKGVDIVYRLMKVHQPKHSARNLSSVSQCALKVTRRYSIQWPEFMTPNK